MQGILRARKCRRGAAYFISEERSGDEEEVLLLGSAGETQGNINGNEKI